MTRRRLFIPCCLLLVVAVHPVDVRAADAEGSQRTVEVGGVAPDFTMTGIDGKKIKLSDITGEGKHVVLMFSRAHW